jgi:hypothetical protein
LNYADGIATAAALIEQSQVGSFVRGAAWAYPVANLLHLLGMILLIGGIGLLDLRIAGAFRAVPLIPLSQILVPLAIAGLVLMLISGPLLFAADAVSLSRSPLFAWKLAIVAIAITNAVIFRLCWDARAEKPPLALRVMAVASIALWVSTACLGRLIAYF